MRGRIGEGKKLGYARSQFTQNYPNALMMKGQSEKEREEKETLRERITGRQNVCI